MKNIDLLRLGEKLLISKNIPNPILDAEIILSNALNTSRENLLINLENKINNYKKTKFLEKINSRMQKVPIAYLINKKEFWSTEFYVDQRVLIPRPDTELIVENALKLIPNNLCRNILDIGSGSGCILISILKERKNCKGTCLDISKDALNVAKFNAKMQHVENRIKFINTNIDNFFSYKYDLIVTNPPYLNKLNISNLEEDVKCYEPRIALDGGLDGFSEINKIIKKCSSLMKKNGKLIIEVDEYQINKTNKLLKNFGFYPNFVSKDLSGKNRNIISSKI